MGAAASQQLPLQLTWDQVPCDARSVALRLAAFESFSRVHPGVAFYWAEHANFVYRRGGGVEAARPIYRAALAHCADYDRVYGFWIGMEEDHWTETSEGGAGAGEPRAVRELFEEWRDRSEADAAAGGRDRRLLWSRYIFFELEHGGAERVRAMAAAAAAACPRDARVRAECVMAEVRLGDDARARAAFDRALADFGDDAEWRRQLTEEMRRQGAYLSERWFGGGCLSFCRGCWFRPYRWWEQI